MKPLELGCTPWLPWTDGHAGVLARQARLAEELGYGSFWLPENHFGPAATPEPLMLLAAVAAATQRIRLATTSYLLPLRHPVQAAAQVAVLDRLSGGRVILGVGRGFAPELFQTFGVARSAKRELFAECLAGMRAAWSGEPIGSAGVRLSPLPVQQPHPPVWVAAFGPKALAQAGTLGLPYLASPLESLATLADNHARHRAACEAAGQPLPVAVPVMRTVFVSRDAARIAALRSALERRTEEMRAQATHGARDAIPRTPAARLDEWALVGSPAEVLDAIGRYRERLGMTHLIATRLLLPDAEAGECEQSLCELADVVSAA